ncbi:MAG: hypothetical protein AAGA48_33925 [Myxococcota bacterium]
MVVGTRARAVIRRVATSNAVALVVLALGTASACRNPCQNVCVRLAEFSRDCGVAVPDADVNACFDAQQDVSTEDAQSCRDFGSPQALDNNLNCDDLDLLWGEAARGDT